MDDIDEYLLVPQPRVDAAAPESASRAATDAPAKAPAAAAGGADPLGALRKLLHDKAVLEALLRLAGPH